MLLFSKLYILYISFVNKLEKVSYMNKYNYITALCSSSLFNVKLLQTLNPIPVGWGGTKPRVPERFISRNSAKAKSSSNHFFQVFLREAAKKKSFTNGQAIKRGREGVKAGPLRKRELFSNLFFYFVAI